MINNISIIMTVIMLPFFSYLALISAAAILGRRRRREFALSSPLPRFVFVIPAHDEEENIGSTVESCRGVSYDPADYRVIVIADNCSDGTPDAARLAGAEVIVRTDTSRRSKGHALDYFFVQHPDKILDCDAVVLVDADSVVDPDILNAFASALSEGMDWIQCYYTVRNPDASWRTRMLTYAFSLFNGVWLLGQDHLGLGVGLKGNGMCFSTRGLKRYPWSAHGLTEDLEFSWILRLAGERIHFLPTTRVYGAMPSQGGSAAATQRCRWEAGRKALRGKFLGPLLRTSGIGPFTKLMYVMDLVFPPLGTLLLGLLVFASLQILAGLATGVFFAAPWVMVSQFAMGLVLMCYALSPCFALGLPVRYLFSMTALPYYAVWKLHVTMGRRPTAWVRTAREPSTRSDALKFSSPRGTALIDGARTDSLPECCPLPQPN